MPKKFGAQLTKKKNNYHYTCDNNKIVRSDFMEKIDVMLVATDEKSLENVAKNLNLDAINLVGAVTDIPKKQVFAIGKEKIPAYPFLSIARASMRRKNFFWLICGTLDTGELLKLKKFLAAAGVAEEKIINVEIFSQFSRTWLANVRHVEKFGADFFATGDEHMRDNLNLKFLPSVHEDKNFSRGGANLSDAFQDLRQSFLTAKHVFEHVKRGTIKFVLIGLTPKSFLYDNAKDFINCSKNLQYLSLTNSGEEDVLQSLFGKKLKEIFATTEPADLNFDGLKESLDGTFSAKSIAEWEDDALCTNSGVVEKNIQILKEYINLCRENEAQPVGVIFPFASAACQTYDEKILSNFRETIHQLEENDGFECVDMFDLKVGYDSFRDMTHLNAKGMKIANAFLALNLYKKRLIPLESFCDMTYEYFHTLSNIAPKDDYNALMEKVFEASAQLIRRKEKIKLGFVVHPPELWCGDDLYNYFAQDDRFEPTVFLGWQSVNVDNELSRKNFLTGLERFKSRSLNVVGIENSKTPIPPQDVLIYLTPYLSGLLRAFQAEKLTAKTLAIYIPYGVSSVERTLGRNVLTHTAWKFFATSIVELEDFKKKSSVGLPRGLFSGHPKTDVFFDKTEFNFEWKTVRPDAKKIIWAPHWSMSGGIRQATFQWNFQFMYEFAKDHPEISWVVKPHPRLLRKAIDGKIFSSVEDFKEYLQKWDELPNAKVYTGTYYQAIFATSDGMIHDSGSFINEYQYVDKPMIFLTREGEKFNELGNEVLKVSYLVDGKNLEAIAALMQKVFIEGNDDKAAARKKVFDKYLNYLKANGMPAAEFIYKSIADELKRRI